MGLGKTVVTLTSIAYMLGCGYLRGVLVVGPKRVCHMVWRQEAQKWGHTQHLTFATLLGNGDMRCQQLLRAKANIYLINYDNLKWLAEVLQTYFISKKRPLPFDGIVFDEITKLKNSSTHRVRELAKILPHFRWRTGLTGTPASNGYKDLHGQYLVLDGGRRLGTSKTQFMTRWYKNEGPYKKSPYSDTNEQIKMLIGDMTLEMSAADYNPLPDMMVNDIMIDLPDDLRAIYDRMEEEFFIQLESGAVVDILSKATLLNKCLQFSNGAMYPQAGMPAWEAIHDLKLEALEDILEEANGQPVLCSYTYRSDAERIMTRFNHLSPINLSECHSERSLKAAMDAWVTGRCRLMIGHPASMGHGLDGLQKTGHIIVWYGLNWSLDLYNQMNARIRRQGQGVPVICHRILCTDTFDVVQSEALESKAETETALRQAVKNYRQNKQQKLLQAA